MRVFKEALKQLPASVKKVYLRTDGAGYQEDFLEYCAEGYDSRFGVIEFAVSARVCEGMKKSIGDVDEASWHPLYDYDSNGGEILTTKQWAEVCFIPQWICRKKSNPEYRYIAIREPLSHINKKIEDLPFPVVEKNNQHYKCFAVITNRLTLPGEELIKWHRQRCGKSEEVHLTQKNDLLGGRFPSKRFGADAAWWLIMILAFNIEAIMQRVVIKKPWENCHLKALRAYFINKPAYIITHGRQMIVRWSTEYGALVDWLFVMRIQIMRLERAPP